jgi:hypothetical protein
MAMSMRRIAGGSETWHKSLVSQLNQNNDAWGCLQVSISNENITRVGNAGGVIKISPDFTL